MPVFKDIGDIYFDKEFVLDPYPYIEDIYHDPVLKGFRSCGMDFIIKHDDAKTLLLEHEKVAREPMMTGDAIAREASYAKKYPARAFMFEYCLTDLRAKGLLNKYLSELINNIDLQLFEPMFAELATIDEKTNYLDSIRSLPMRCLLMAWGFEFSEEQLEEIFIHGTTFVKSFDNYQDESMTALGSQSVGYIQEYIKQSIDNLPEGSLLKRFVEDSRSRDIDDKHTIGNLGGFITSVGNTLTITTAYMLRNLIRYPEVAESLRNNETLLDKDHVILEFLRRDNHVKALSRQVHEPFNLNGLHLRPGQSVYLFYPGINLDPNHWENPLDVDFTRDLRRENHMIFGGSRYTCIGARVGMVYLKGVLKGILRYLPQDACLDVEAQEIESGWITERVISSLPIQRLNR